MVSKETRPRAFEIRPENLTVFYHEKAHQCGEFAPRLPRTSKLAMALRRWRQMLREIWRPW